MLCVQKTQRRSLFKGDDLFPKQGKGGHGFVIVQIAYHSVGGTDVDTRHVGIGKKGENGTVCLWGIGHGQMLFRPEAGNAFRALLTGDADEPEIRLAGKVTVKGVHTGQFLLAVGALGVEEHHHGALAQQGVAREEAAVGGHDRKVGQGVAHQYA